MGLNRRTIRKGKKKSNNKSKEKEIKQMLDKLDLYDFQRQTLEESIKKVGVGIELSNSEENIEDIIKTLVETSPELNDEVTEASEENVIVEIEIMDTKENINNTVYSEEAIKAYTEALMANNEALRENGAETGDDVSIADFTFEFVD